RLPLPRRLLFREAGAGASRAAGGRLDPVAEWVEPDAARRAAPAALRSPRAARAAPARALPRSAARGVSRARHLARRSGRGCGDGRAPDPEELERPRLERGWPAALREW